MEISKDVLLKALGLQYIKDIDVITTKVDTASDFEEVAKLYDELAEITRAAGKDFAAVEAKYEVQ